MKNVTPAFCGWQGWKLQMVILLLIGLLTSFLLPSISDKNEHFLSFKLPTLHCVLFPTKIELGYQLTYHVQNSETATFRWLATNQTFSVRHGVCSSRSSSSPVTHLLLTRSFRLLLANPVWSEFSLLLQDSSFMIKLKMDVKKQRWGLGEDVQCCILKPDRLKRDLLVAC